TWPADYDGSDSLARFRGLSEQDAPFRAWRALRVSRFYGDLAERIQSSGASRHFLLLTEELFDDAEFVSRTRPRLNGSIAWNELLREAGIDAEAFSTNNQITLLRPNFIADGRPLPDSARDLQINSSEDL